jgi:MFS family permease
VHDEPVLPIRLAFAVFGVFWGSWAVATLDIQRQLGLDNRGLGLLVAATVGGTTVANVVGGTLAERFGAARALTITLLVWGPLLAAAAAVPAGGVWMAVFLVVVAAGGMLDVVANIASAAVLGNRPGRLLRLHAAYNSGALAGAALTGLVLRFGGSQWWRVAWATAGVLAIVLAARIHRRPGWVEEGPPGQHVTLRDAIGEVRRSRLQRLAVVFLLGAAVEGGIGVFGVKYLREHLDVAVLGGAGAYVAGQALATGTRLVLGVDDERMAGTAAAKLGLLVAGAGLALEAATDLPALAAVGLALASIGAATYWPLLSAVATQSSDRPGLAVGGMSAAGYLGFLLGPVLVGAVADGIDLRAGVLVLAAIGLAAASTPLRRLAPEGPAVEHGRGAGQPAEVDT